MPESSAVRPRPARRLCRLPLYWHLARWRADEPGPRGLLLLALLSVALLVPLETFGADLAWTTQARTLVTLGAFVAAVMFGRSTGLPDDAEHWLLQLGKSPADWALERWSASLLPLAALSLLWTVAVAVTTWRLGGLLALDGLVALFVQLGATAVVVTVLLLAIGACGVRQTTELALLLLILTVAIPLAAARIPDSLEPALRAISVPLFPVATLRNALADARWREAAAAALHIATWCAAALGLAVWRLQRRLPS